MLLYFIFLFLNLFLGYYFLYDKEESKFEKYQSIIIIILISLLSVLSSIAYLGYYVIKKFKPFGH